MPKQIIIGFSTEGSTDVMFMESIILRTFEDLAFDCDGQIEVLPVHHIERESGNFVESVKKTAQQAEIDGIMVLCIHCDADNSTDNNIFEHKINPAFTAVNTMKGNNVCNTLVAIVPVHMTEAWMLSDKILFKSEIGSNKSDVELGIEKFPEKYRDPKATISNAIRVARQGLTKRRRRNLTINELYSPLGQKISLTSLNALPSYKKFRKSVRDALIKLHYLH